MLKIQGWPASKKNTAIKGRLHASLKVMCNFIGSSPQGVRGARGYEFPGRRAVLSELPGLPAALPLPAVGTAHFVAASDIARFAAAAERNPATGQAPAPPLPANTAAVPRDVPVLSEPRSEPAARNAVV